VLHDVRQLVGQNPSAKRRVGSEGSIAEKDVAAQREGTRVEKA
jgi:hypothetical protein